MQAHTHACGCQRWLPPTPPIWFVLFLFTCWECMSVCVPVGVCMCRPQVYARRLLPFHIFKTGSLTKAEVYQFGYTMWPASWNSTVSASLRLGLPCLAFHVCAVDLNSRPEWLWSSRSPSKHFTTEPSPQLHPPFLHWIWSSLSSQAYQPTCSSHIPPAIPSTALTAVCCCGCCGFKLVSSYLWTRDTTQQAISPGPLLVLFTFQTDFQISGSHIFFNVRLL